MVNEQQFKRQRKGHQKKKQSEEDESPRSSAKATAAASKEVAAAASKEEEQPKGDSKTARSPVAAAAKQEIKSEESSEEESSESEESKQTDRTKIVSPTSRADQEHFVIVEHLTKRKKISKDCCFCFPEARPGLLFASFESLSCTSLIYGVWHAALIPGFTNGIGAYTSPSRHSAVSD